MNKGNKYLFIDEHSITVYYALEVLELYQMQHTLGTDVTFFNWCNIFQPTFNPESLNKPIYNWPLIFPIINYDAVIHWKNNKKHDNGSDTHEEITAFLSNDRRSR